ncbi:MAG: PspC domain-containing protein [Candidatus Zixiibacteriota bacterium]
MGLDPTLVRIITVLLFILPGIGILTYIIAWIIIPMRPE